MRIRKNGTESLTQELKCKDYEKSIISFLNNDLEIKELKQFLSHIEHCEDCKEELSIQFLVSEGMNALENGDSYDLQTALTQRLQEAYGEIRVNRHLYKLRNLFMVMVLALILVFAWFLHIYL